MMNEENYLRPELISKLHDLAGYAFKDKKLNEIIGSFMKNVVPYYKSNRGVSMYEVEKEPVKELESFWHDVESIMDYEFSDLDKRVLTTEPVMPAGFLKELIAAADKWKSISAIHEQFEYTKEFMSVARMINALDTISYRGGD